MHLDLLSFSFSFMLQMGHFVKVSLSLFVVCVLGYLRISLQDSFKRKALFLIPWEPLAPCSSRLSVHVTGVCGRGWPSRFQEVQGEQSLQIPVEGGVLHVTELCSFAVNGFSCGLWDYLLSPPVQNPLLSREGGRMVTKLVTYFWEEMW